MPSRSRLPSSEMGIGVGLRAIILANCPMVADCAVVPAQAELVVRALASMQQHALDWGGDERRIVTMGHSAGARLVSLVNADARLCAKTDVEPVLGGVSVPRDKRHGEINAELGLPGACTDAVNEFSASLAPSLRLAPGR